jgi:8-oxo-dGTP pyrophosphatase MutT (NUDIX family)/cytidylate kinase
MLSEGLVILVSALVFNRNKQILLLKRSAKNNTYQGFWQFPEGKIEDNESPRDAISRELVEEIGQANIEPELRYVVPAKVVVNNKTFWVVRVVFVTQSKGKIQIKQDHEDYKWFGIFTIVNIILFTGLSASGKTTLAKKVAGELEAPMISLHEIGREIALNKGFSRTREWAIDVGLENAIKESGNVLISAVEHVRNEPVILVDEVLDLRTKKRLEEHFSEANFFTIYIKSNRHDRARWCIQRSEGLRPSTALKEMRQADHLKWLVGIKEIIQAADVEICYPGRIEETTGRLIEILGEKNITISEVSIRREKES